MKAKTLGKYLDHYAEPEARLALTAPFPPTARWDHVVAVPARAEHQLLPGMLASLAGTDAARSGKVLLIILVNGNETDNDDRHISNQKAVTHLTKLAKATQKLADAPPMTLYEADSFSFILVERWQEPYLLRRKEGVGHVRKIGTDVALALYQRGLIASPWLHNTDADARLPADYFTLEPDPNRLNGASAYLYDHHHIPASESDGPTSTTWFALVQYELWLRYYVLGLRHAGSPYAFHSIGSLLAIHAEDYAATRGFPRRQAAEDFYLLNKLAKVGAIRTRQGQPVQLLARESDRVPFGTGQGTIKIKALLQQDLNYDVYHPKVFEVLKAVLQASVLTIKSESVDFSSHLAHALTALTLSEDQKQKSLGLLLPLALDEALAGAIKRSRDQHGALRQFHDWFDGFKTLKLVHNLRDEIFGTLPILTALKQASFLSEHLPEPSNAMALTYLDIVRRLDHTSYLGLSQPPC